MLLNYKLRFYVLLDTNTGLNFLFIVEVPPLGKCRPGRSPIPFRCATASTSPRWNFAFGAMLS